MAVESKIVYRADASEVKAATSVIRASRLELERFNGASGGKQADRLAVIREQGAQRRGLLERRFELQRQTRQERLAEAQRAKNRRVEEAHQKRMASGPHTSTRSRGGGNVDIAGMIPGGRATELLGMAGVNALPAALIGGAALVGGMFSKAVIDAQSFRESTTLSMKAYLGSAQAASAWFDNALKLSQELKTNAFDTIDGMSRLRAAGFDDTSVTNLTKAFADIKRLSPDADLKSIAMRLAQIRATGKLQGDELNELANAWPAARDVIFKQMSKDLGKTQAELQTMQRAGKITPDMVEKALLGGVSALTKMPLGEFAKANADTLRGLFDQVMAIPSHVFLGFDASPETDKIKGTLKEIVDFFSATSKSGKEVRRVAKDTFSAIVEGLFGVDTKKGGTKETLQAILDIIKNSRGDIKEFAGNIRIAVGAIATFIGWISKAKNLIGSMRGDEVTGGDNGGVAWWITRLLPPIPPLLIAQAVKRNWDSIKEAVSSAASSVGDFGMTLWDSGVRLVDGFINGIMSRIGGVVTAATSVASSAAGAVKGFLGIKSPSRLAMTYGVQFDRGMALGIERFAHLPSQAANDVAVGTAEAAHPSLGASTTVNNSAFSTGGTVSYAPSIVVGAGASPDAVRAAYEAQAEQDANFDAMMDRHSARRASEIAA